MSKSKRSLLRPTASRRTEKKTLRAISNLTLSPESSHRPSNTKPLSPPPSSLSHPTRPSSDPTNRITKRNQKPKSRQQRLRQQAAIERALERQGVLETKVKRSEGKLKSVIRERRKEWEDVNVAPRSVLGGAGGMLGRREKRVKKRKGMMRGGRGDGAGGLGLGDGEMDVDEGEEGWADDGSGDWDGGGTEKEEEASKGLCGKSKAGIFRGQSLKSNGDGGGGIGQLDGGQDPFVDEIL